MTWTVLCPPRGRNEPTLEMCALRRVCVYRDPRHRLHGQESARPEASLWTPAQQPAGWPVGLAGGSDAILRVRVLLEAVWDKQRQAGSWEGHAASGILNQNLACLFPEGLANSCSRVPWHITVSCSERWPSATDCALQSVEIMKLARPRSSLLPQSSLLPALCFLAYLCKAPRSKSASLSASRRTQQ